MCDPVSMATANQMKSALFIANETNKVTNTYNQSLADNFAVSASQLQMQRQQTGAQARQQQSEIARKAQQERSRLAALALESGAGGNTAQRLQATAALDAQDAINVTERNLNGALNQSQLQEQALRQQTLAQYRQGVNWDGLSLQLQGIQLSGQAQNGQRIAAEQAKAKATKTMSFGDSLQADLARFKADLKR